jgi:hypothetical protein
MGLAGVVTGLVGALGSAGMGIVLMVAAQVE